MTLHDLHCSRRQLLVGLGGAIAVAGIGPSNVSATPRWERPGANSTGAMYRGNPARTGEYPGPALTSAPVVLWRADIGPTESSPVVAGDLVLSHAGDRLWAFDRGTGALRWQAGASQNFSSPAAGGGLVVVGTAAEGLRAFDWWTGEERWTFVTGDAPVPNGSPANSIPSSPVIVDDIVYTGGSGSGGLFALDLATGAERWRFETGGATVSSPAYAGGVLFIGTAHNPATERGGGTLYAVTATTGKERWSSELGPSESFQSTPAVSGNFVVIGSDFTDGSGGRFVFVERSTGLMRGTTSSWAPLGTASAAIVGEVAIMPLTGQGDLHAFNMLGPNPAWGHTFGDDLFASPIVVESILYQQLHEGDLAALDIVSKVVLWTYETGGVSSPAAADGNLYVHGDGTLMALGAA